MNEPIVNLEIRPIRDDDGDRLVQFHEGLDGFSQYLRFFMPHPHLSTKEVDRFTHVDQLGRQALVGICDGQIVAVGRSEELELEPGTAEVAFIVAPAWRNHGLATKLLHRLADGARARRVTTFVAETLPDNVPMRQVFRDAGFPVSSRLEDGLHRVRMDISVPPVQPIAGLPGSA